MVYACNMSTVIRGDLPHAHAYKSTQNKGDRINDLHDMVCNEPHVSAAIRRLTNNCLSRGFSIKERDKSLDAGLLKNIHDIYMECLRASVEMAITCGFVAFYVRRVGGIPVPFVPPPGTFTWCVLVADQHNNGKRKRNHAILEFSINMTCGHIKSEEMHIVNWRTPSLITKEDQLISPLENVLSTYNNFTHVLKMSQKKETWNSEKHVVVTEQLDIKDPTPSGIQLLDDTRRYSLSGQRGQNGHGSRLYTRVNNQNIDFSSVVDAKFHWIKSQFPCDDNGTTHTHIMPPNTEVTELTALQNSEMLYMLQEMFHTAVYTFFNGSSPLTTNTGGKYMGSATQDHVSRAQQVAVISMCNWLQRVCTIMYSTSFKVPENSVTVTIAARSRFEINGTDDVKTLVDAQVLTALDTLKLRALYMGEDGLDPI